MFLNRAMPFAVCKTRFRLDESGSGNNIIRGSINTRFLPCKLCTCNALTLLNPSPFGVGVFLRVFRVMTNCYLAETVALL